LLNEISHFKSLAFVRIISALAQVATAVVFAYLGFGVWSVVAGSLAYGFVQCVLLFVFSKEKLKLGFSKIEFQSMWKSSTLFLAEAFLTWFNQAADIFFIGKFLGTYEAGVFKNSYTTVVGIVALFSAIYSPIVVSLFSKIQDDSDSFREIFYKYQKVMSFLLIPAGFGLLIFSNFFALVFFGEGWEGASLVIGLFGLMMCIKRASGDFLMLAYTAVGKPLYLVIIDSVYSIAIIAVTLLFGRYGFTQYVIARSSVIVIPIIVSFVLARKVNGLSWKMVVGNMALPFALSIGMSILGLGLQVFSSSILWNAVFAFTCAIFYFFLFWISDSNDLKILWSTILSRNEKTNEKTTPPIVSASHPSDETKKHSFNYQINGFRFFLCLLIVLYHFGIRYFEKYQGVTTQNVWLPNSSIIVSIFFILSGYFIRYDNLKSYLKNKFFGIYFPYALSLCIIFPICFYFAQDYTVSLSDFKLNFLVLPLLIGKAQYVDGAQWYIAYLLLFDLYFLVFSLLSKKKGNQILDALMLCFGILCFSGCFLSAWQNETITKIWNTFLSQRFLFIVLGYFLKRFPLNPSSFSKQNILLIGSVIVSFGMALASIAMIFFWINIIYFLLLFSLLVGCVCEKLRLFVWKPFQIFGSSSLFIYLIHQNFGYIIINSFLKLDSSLYWAGILSAVLFSMLFGWLFAWLYKFLINRIESIGGEPTAKK
jgi:peptidoglycan/LPS O-acetylase OafA/YrhL